MVVHFDHRSTSKVKVKVGLGLELWFVAKVVGATSSDGFLVRNRFSGFSG